VPDWDAAGESGPVRRRKAGSLRKGRA
jgi:hypothetical protein